MGEDKEEMNSANDSIFHDIERCGLCDGHKPFHFEMGRQKVVLISLAPSYATLHRPLYFIQLFRKICLALFGDVMPSEDFIKEFYDPAGNIYWTHYQKCFKHGDTAHAAKCGPLLVKEIETLDPELIIVLGHETIRRLYGHAVQCGAYGHDLPSDMHTYIKQRKDGAPRKVFLTDYPQKGNEGYYEEIRKALKPYIGWVKTECESLDFSSSTFMDLEYASIESLNAPEEAAAAPINRFEHEWVNGIILPNIRAYNLILQSFIFIESNIKNLLWSIPGSRDDIERIWFSPFREILFRKFNGDTDKDKERRQAVRLLMDDIDSLQALRNIIAHKNGIIDDRDEERNLKDMNKLKRLKGVYIYGGNSVFISQEGIEHILAICKKFKRIYNNSFVHRKT